MSILALLYPTTLAGLLPMHFQGLLEPAGSKEGLQEGKMHLITSAEEGVVLPVCLAVMF